MKIGFGLSSSEIRVFRRYTNHRVSPLKKTFFKRFDKVNDGGFNALKIFFCVERCAGFRLNGHTFPIVIVGLVELGLNFV
jgi:hypothetical protein